MIKKIDKNRQKLFDGLEDDFYSKNFIIEVQNHKLDFIAFEVTPNKLYKSDFKNMISDSNPDFIIDADEDIYKNEDGLTSYFLVKHNYLLVFALGEYQPGRYMLFLEQIWYL